MNVEVEPGKYVIAVSGGVDSVALLHLLNQNPDLKLTVAHYDHGIREHSYRDRQFVHQLTSEYKLPFIYDEGNLGSTASEAAARKARYEFLQKVAKVCGADGIIIAHHQDDVLETAIINILRGTGRKGLSSLGSTHQLIRPATHIPKEALVDYAREQGLVWQEDETNTDETYLRNYVRHRLTPRFDYDSRQQLVDLIETLRRSNAELDHLLEAEISIHSIENRLDRNWFVQLPHDVAKEIMASWLRLHGVREFDKRTIERLVVCAKVGQIGSRFDVIGPTHMRVEIDNLALEGYER